MEKKEEKYISIAKIENLYTGSISEHNKETCSDCKAGKPCQYEVEGEFIKLGKGDIEEGQKFVEAWTTFTDGYRLIDKDGITYDLTAEQFDNFIMKINEGEKLIRYAGKQFYCKTKAQYLEHHLLAMIDCKTIASSVGFNLLEDLIKEANKLYPDEK